MPPEVPPLTLLTAVTDHLAAAALPFGLWSFAVHACERSMRVVSFWSQSRVDVEYRVQTFPTLIERCRMSAQALEELLGVYRSEAEVSQEPLPSLLPYPTGDGTIIPSLRVVPLLCVRREKSREDLENDEARYLRLGDVVFQTIGWPVEAGCWTRVGSDESQVAHGTIDLALRRLLQGEQELVSP